MVFEMIDLYCERTGSGLWGEPVNVLTNGAFILAAWLIWTRARALGVGSPQVALLILLMFAIGFGSLLFHLLATNWAALLDILPILFFQLIYVWTYARSIVGMRWRKVAGFVLAYLIAAVIVRQFPEMLNGSLHYLPPLLVLLTIAVYHLVSRKNEPYAILAGTLLFVLSLVFRTLDAAVCPYLPLGIHFMWHLCNAAVLYLLMRGLLANLRSAA